VDCTLGGSCAPDNYLEGEGRDEEEALLDLKRQIDEEGWKEVTEDSPGADVNYSCLDCVEAFKDDCAHGWENISIPVAKGLQVKSVDYNGDPNEKVEKLQLLGKRRGSRVYAVGRCSIRLMGEWTEGVSMGVFDVVRVGKESTLKKKDVWISTQDDILSRLKQNGMRNPRKFVKQALEAHKKAYWPGT
jgi:hypothetical protein